MNMRNSNPLKDLLLGALLAVGLAAGTAQAALSGSVATWGQVGTTTPLVAQSGVIAVTVGASHTVVLKTDGSVVGWGFLHSATGTVVFPAGSGVTAIAAGDAHTLALKSDGSVAAWGYNHYGQSTVPVAAQSGVVAIAAGEIHSVALKSDGSVVAWGDYYDPAGTIVLPAGSGVTAIAAGGDQTMILKNDGSVVAWKNSSINEKTTLVGPQSGVTAVAGGFSHTVALKNDGSLLMWGGNDFGQTNVPVAAQSGVAAIAAGYYHTAVLKSNGTVVAWGDNDEGQVTGTPTPDDPLSATASPVTYGGQVLNGVMMIGAGGRSTDVIVTPTPPAVSLEEALDTVGTLSWTTTNASSWAGQSDVTHDGLDAAASPMLTNNSTSAMFQTFVTGPGTISFWWKVSSEANNDRLVFSINGVEQARISGEVDWQSRSFALPAGNQLLRFVYQKNASLSAGQDRAWVDQVQLSGPPLVVNCSSNKTVPCGDPWAFDPPTGVVGCGGSNVTVQVFDTVTNSSTGPCSYQTTRTWLITDVCSNQTTCAQTVTIVDTNPPPCTYALSPTNATLGSSSTTSIVSVATASGCSWTVINTNAWVSILSGASGSGSGTVLYQVAANPNTTARTANLLIANQPFTITQSGVPTGACTYALSPGSASFNSGSSTGFVSVTAPGGCAWSTINTNPWIAIVIGANGSGSGTVRYDVAANPSSSSRDGNLLIAGQIFPVSQSGILSSGDPVILGQPINQSVLVGGTATFSVTVSNMNAYPGVNGYVYAAVTDGSGTLYVGGNFNTAGHVSANRIAQWNGSNWSALGSGMDGVVAALAVSGNDLYAAGSFTNAGGFSANRIAKWNGTNWSALGTGMDGSVSALAVVGGDLYAGGGFTKADGLTANGIAKWNGSSWTALGSGMNRDVVALAVVGGDLYAGGFFTNAGGITANRVARWNGSNWSAVGSGMDREVNALAVVGNDLYAGGSFFTADGNTVNRIAKWDGSSWSALGSGMNLEVSALAVSGSDLYAGGKFITAGGIGAGAIARWNGSNWSAVGSGMTGELVDAVDPFVRAITVSGSDVFAGGGFLAAGGLSAVCIAKWNGNDWSALGPPPIVFQWQFNGVNLTNGGGISGANSSTLVLNNVQISQAGNYRVVVSTINGNLLSSSALLSASSNATITLPQALDTESSSLVWTTGGSAPWLGQAIVSHDGVDAAESGAAPDSGNSYVQTVVTGPGVLTFWWKVSSQTNSDQLSFSIGGIAQAVISGEAYWTQRTFSIPVGTQTLLWKYAKNSSGAAGQDRGWLDQVQYVSTPCAVTITPSNRTHSAAAQSATVSVYVPDSCEWAIVNTNAWVSFVPTIGGVSNSVLYTLTSNTSASARSGALVIGNWPFVITQLGSTNPACTYTVSPASRTHGYGASSNFITLSTISGCPWSVVNTNPWLSFPLTNGTGGAAVGYSVAANGSSSARSGYVGIANKTVFITQNGAPGGTNGATNCTITLSPTGRTHDFASSTGTVSVSTSSNCLWSVVETNTWIAILSSGSGIGNGTVTYTVAANSGSTTRTGYIIIGGQTFTVKQTGTPPVMSPFPVNIPPIEVTNIGHLFINTNTPPGATNGVQGGNIVHDFLIDQGHVADGGAVLPDLAVNWDTNTQFTITVAAPAGKKFVVETPPGSQVGFSGFLWWESTRGGFSPGGTAAAHFENLEGTAPEFSGASPVLSDSHGFFGFSDLEGTTVTTRFAFTSLTLTGSVTAQFTGNGTENYIPHLGSMLQLYCSTTDTNDPGQFVFIVPAGPLPLIQMVDASPEAGVELVVFGLPGRTHIVECSPDTVNWTQIASGVMPPAGSMQVRDASKTSSVNSRFYRVVELP